MLARRLHTREWWDLERRHFELWTSALSDGELRLGAFPRQSECRRIVRRLRYLPFTAAAKEMAKEILDLMIVPSQKGTDAAHLAIATTHDMDYLLTWNYAHMANPFVQERLDKLCKSAGNRAPLMVSPESIPQVRLGQSIRRRE